MAGIRTTRRLHWLFVSVAVAAAAAEGTGQATLVVDRLGRPGADFADLPAAVAAAAPGDVLVVRHTDPLVAPYTGPTITKSLTVVGVGGQPGVTGALRVELLPAGAHVVVRNLRLAPFASGSATVGDCSLLIRANRGSVHLREVGRDAVQTPLYPLNQWVIENSRLVTLGDCSFPVVAHLAAPRVADTELLVLYRSRFSAGVLAALPTLSAQRSTLELVDSVVTGGVALGVCESSIVLAGAGTSVLGGGGAPAIDGGSCTPRSTVRIGPGATIGSTRNVTITPGDVAALGARIDAARGLAAQVHGPALGAAAFVYGASAATPSELPFGRLYLEPTTLLVLHSTGLDALGTGTWHVTVPASVAAGAVVWLQGITVDGAGGALRLTTPAVVVVP